MRRVEFRLSMPNVASWNGKWTGEGRNYSIVKKLSNKLLAFLGLDIKNEENWYHSWSDGWGANVHARVLEPGESVRKSDGFGGYDWMVKNILTYNSTKEPNKNY